MPSSTFVFSRSPCSSLMDEAIQPAERILAQIRREGDIKEFERQVAQGVPLIRRWTDLAAPLCRLSGISSSDEPRTPLVPPHPDSASIIWLAGHAASVLPNSQQYNQVFTGSNRSDSDWRSLWRTSVLASRVTLSGHALPQGCSAPVHLMVALALDFNLPCALGYEVDGSALLEAADIFAACLAPFQSVMRAPPDILPASLLPRVRNWLLDGLTVVPDPYGKTPWLPINSAGHAVLPVSASPPRVMTRRESYLSARPLDWAGTYRDELAWALDHTVAVILKRRTRTGVEHLPTLDLLENFQERLGHWPQANASLLRTNGFLNRWPGAVPKITPDLVEPVSVDDLLCANALPYVLIDLVRKKRVLSTKTLVDWLQRPAESGRGTGDILRLLRSPTPLPHARTGLMRYVLSLLGSRPLPCENGATIAHLFLGLHPTATSVALLARVLGPEALLVPNNAGLSPMDLARTVLKQSGVSRVSVTVSRMECVLLEETQRRVARPPGGTRPRSLSRVRKL